MNLPNLTSTSKEEVFSSMKNYIKDLGLTVTYEEERPWGKFFYIDEDQISHFVSLFFKDEDLSDVVKVGKKQPKILVVTPGEILSWQYHDRRAELWNLVAGEAEYKASTTNEEPDTTTPLELGKTVRLAQGTRHRLVGATYEGAPYGIVAEIWQHTDSSNLSTEEDNYRLKDKYARS